MKIKDVCLWVMQAPLSSVLYSLEVKVVSMNTFLPEPCMVARILGLARDRESFREDSQSRFPVDSLSAKQADPVAVIFI